MGAHNNERLTAVSFREAAEASDVVTGTFCINSKPIKVLFDYGASYSFVSKSKIADLGLEEAERTSYSVSIPSGETFHCDLLFYDIPLKIGKTTFLSDLFS